MDNKQVPQDINLLKGSDFASSTRKEAEKPSSDLDSDKKSDEFTELEKSRMDRPPEHREDNGSDQSHVDEVNDVNQSDGV